MVDNGSLCSELKEASKELVEYQKMRDKFEDWIVGRSNV